MTKPQAKQNTLAPASTAQWMNRGSAVYIEGKAHLDGVDALAVEMERKWGAGRLRLLVEPEWRAKFDSQRVKLNHACWHGDFDDVQREAGRMQSAWRKLDALAAEAGKAPIAPEVWEIALEDGKVAAIVRSPSEAHAVAAEGRWVNVYSLEEIARLLHGFPALAAAKITFPGATVVAVREPTDPKWSEVLDDEIPF